MNLSISLPVPLKTSSPLERVSSDMSSSFSFRNEKSLINNYTSLAVTCSVLYDLVTSLAISLCFSFLVKSSLLGFLDSS